ncbi:hypothetical protein E4U21_003406 [Claviceps maximensis]|nr:hypothetical protein E4U21_003406 [Claviceps maximensis]
MSSHRKDGYNTAVEQFRAREYPMLQGMTAAAPSIVRDAVYLDHAGSTPCAKSLMDVFAREMTHSLYGNPHSGSLSSQLSTSRIDDVRLRLLGFFNADPKEYDLVFVANATAGVKLVVEAMRALPQGYSYVYHQSCHTSLVGAREDAKQSLCVDDSDVISYLGGDELSLSVDRASAALFAYSAQSHMDGRRYPLSWSRDLKEVSQKRSEPLYTLLDAASFSATSRLNLGSEDFAADFTVLSLYKIFGFPDLGALIIRRSAAGIFDNRRYFGGGTVDLVSCSRKEQWHARKSQFLHERLEDGTLPFHSIMALDSAMMVHSDLFGSMDRVSQHTSYLAHTLFHGLQSLHHSNSLPVCVMYTQYQPDSAAPLGVGPVVSFNLKNSAGGWVSLGEVEKLAGLQNIHIRTGGLCSPGKVAAALKLEPWELKRNLSAGFRCGADNEIIGGKPTGVIRASLGAMSTESDVNRFLDFVKEFFVEENSAPLVLAQTRLRSSISSPNNMRVKSITVYPIKSCGGFAVPLGVGWNVRTEGLAWDREWCLIHSGSGQALSQKRYPKMALLRPVFDFDRGVLRVSYDGPIKDLNHPSEVQISLSANPDFLEQQFKQMSSRVCGEEISAQAYLSSEINSFFSSTLDVPCVLARFPAGGIGLHSRTARARFQKHQHQQPDMNRTLPGSFPGIPSPPDSDSDSGGQLGQRKILLSNESPILLVNSSSVDALNEEIVRRGGVGVSDSSYRANVVVEPTVVSRESFQDLAYSEDTWKKIRIGQHEFQLLGSCRRCQMVCVDQVTGTRRQEPFSTLALTRRFDGKVYFGAHMRHEPRLGDLSLSSQSPDLKVGDVVTVEAWLA